MTGNRWLWLMGFSLVSSSYNSHNLDWNNYHRGLHWDSKNYWFGNKHLHIITSNQKTVIESRNLISAKTPKKEHENTLWRLRVEVQDTDGKWFSAEYECFYVGNEAEDYALEVSGYLEEASDMGDGFELLPKTTQCSRCGPECHKSTFVTYNHPDGYSKFGGWWYSSATHPVIGPSSTRLMGALSHLEGWWPAKDSSRIRPQNSRFFFAGASYFE